MDREDLSAGTPRPDPNAKAKHQSNILNKRPAGGGRGGREKKVVRPLSDSASAVGGRGAETVFTVLYFPGLSRDFDFDFILEWDGMSGMEVGFDSLIFWAVLIV